MKSAKRCLEEIENAFRSGDLTEVHSLIDGAAVHIPEHPRLEWWAFNLPYMLAQAEGRLPGFTPEQILHSPYLLDQADLILHRLGLRGEKENRRILLLSAVGGLLEDPIHCSVHGDSAGGKNNLVNSVLKLVPDEKVLVVSGLSARALEYRGGRVEGVFVVEELEGQKGAEYGLRIAMSEQKITRLTVGKNEKSGAQKGEEHTVEVTASIITTTTEVAIHRENSTRVFNLWIDESEALTQEVLQAQSEKARGLLEVPVPEEWEAWKDALRRLEPHEVIIPFATDLQKHFPTNQVRARRDHLRVHALIRASALLFQFQRKRDKRGRVLATLDDYRLVYPLVQRVLGPSMSQLSEKALALCDLHDQLVEETKKTWILRPNLEREADARRVASKNTVHSWCKRLCDLGIWEGRMISRTWEHRSVKGSRSEPIPLPTPDELEASQGPPKPPLGGEKPCLTRVSSVPPKPPSRKGGE